MFVVRDETWELIPRNEREGTHNTIERETECEVLGAKNGARKLMQRNQTLLAQCSDQGRYRHAA
jgi:hypothetical protein